MKYNILKSLILLLFCLNSMAQTFTVSSNKRYILREDKPFFWIGDTAWELFHRLDRDEADFYLNKRASQGFTVIQAVALAEMDGLDTPNAYGDKPLIDNDPTKPNEAYFKHLDFIIDKAAQYGLVIGLLPTWGDKVFKDRWEKVLKFSMYRMPKFMAIGLQIGIKTEKILFGFWVAIEIHDKVQPM